MDERKKNELQWQIDSMARLQAAGEALGPHHTMDQLWDYLKARRPRHDLVARLDLKHGFAVSNRSDRNNWIVWVRCGSDCGGLLGVMVTLGTDLFKIGEHPDGTWQLVPGLAARLKSEQYSGTLMDVPVMGLQPWEELVGVVVECPDCHKRNLFVERELLRTDNRLKRIYPLGQPLILGLGTSSNQP